MISTKPPVRAATCFLSVVILVIVLCTVSLLTAGINDFSYLGKRKI